VNPDAARRRLLSEHHGTLSLVVACADDVASRWDGTVDGEPATDDREAVVGPLAAALERAGVTAAGPDMLSDAVRAAGGGLAADPVAAPPYVVVTSRGLLLRGPGETGRLLIECLVTEPVDGWYVRRGDDPESILRVRFRR